MIKKLLFTALIILSAQLHASHIVGGYFSYECLGIVSADSVEYEITLRIFQDCSSDTIFGGDATSRFTIFESNSNAFLKLGFLPRISRDTIPDDINNPCVVRSPEVCVEEVLYRANINLPRSQETILSYQRCCRNSTIDNVFSAFQQGVTHTITVPAFNQIGCNNSPVFNSFPPIVLCSGFDLNLDLSAVDPDGDSLVYSICSPFNYGLGSTPYPLVSNPPPYASLPYIPPQSASNPIPSNPQVAINQFTGKVTGIPTNLGQYVAGFCLEEYRNGVLINTTRRGIQINTADCDPVITSAVQDQELFCDGLTVRFTNQSTANVNIQSYKWDFGDLSTLSDTSRAFDTIYTYPDTGLYTITLISNPDLPCNDTSTKVFRVYQKLSPEIDFNGQACVNDNNVNFVAKGDYESYASFDWKFGNNASISSSNLDSVPNVSFTGQGTFPVELIVQQDNCSDTVLSSITLFENPIANFDYDIEAGCYPLEVNFRNLSVFTGNAQFLWDFGDGTSSTDLNPVHTYNADGVYDVELELQTTNNCIDTVFKLEQSAIDVSLDSSTNEINFAASQLQACPGTAITFNDASIYEGTADYFWDFGNNDLSNDPSPTYIFNDTGKFDIGLILITKDKCIDTLIKRFDDYIEILPQPISNLVISDSLKPIKDARVTIDATASEFGIADQISISNGFISSSDILDYTFTDTGHFKVQHIIENQFGCTDTTELEVFIFDQFEFIIPNIFTPNGDRINDEFAVKACGVYEYEIEIFNRFGKTMFQSNSMNINWDGYTNEEKASDGIYFYVITIKDFKGDYINYTGNLTLIRSKSF